MSKNETAKTRPQKRLPISTKNRICFVGVVFSLLILIPIIFFFGKSASSPKLFSEITQPSAFSSQERIETNLGTLYLPKGFSLDKEYPLVLIFHGLGESHRGPFFRDTWFSVADEYQLILFSVKSNLSTWYYDKESPDLKNTKSAVRELKKILPIKKNHTILYGFSAGGHYVGYLALHNSLLPEKAWYNYYIQISGGSSIELERYMKKGSIPRHITASAVPGYFVWGERETPPPGKKTAAFLVEQGWDVTTNPHAGMHSVPPGEIERALNWYLKKANE